MNYISTVKLDLPTYSLLTYLVILCYSYITDIRVYSVGQPLVILTCSTIYIIYTAKEKRNNEKSTSKT